MTSAEYSCSAAVVPAMTRAVRTRLTSQAHGRTGLNRAPALASVPSGQGCPGAQPSYTIPVQPGRKEVAAHPAGAMS